MTTPVKPVLGVELRRDVIRAVRVAGWPRRRVRFAEVKWPSDDPAAATSAVEALVTELGHAGRVGVAVDLALLFTKRLRLPPVPAAEKRRIVSLEPDRFFPFRGGEEIVVSARDEDGCVFAVRERDVSAWAAALESLGPLEILEPSPIALARALARAGIRDATVVLDRGTHGIGVVEIAGGRLRSARRLRVELTDARTAIAEPGHPPTAPVWLEPWDDGKARDLGAALGDGTLRALPAVAAVPPEYLAAYGVALGVGTVRDGSLMPPEVARRAGGRRRRELATAAGVCVLAIAFAAASADAARARVERRLDARIEALRTRAAAVSALQQETESLERHARAIALLETKRPDVLEVLRLITAHLPHDAHVRSLRWSEGAEWQLEGRASNAARLVPLFEEHPRFDGVRFLEPTSRVTSRGQTHESFSLALRLVPAP